jgi:hypothetical protein
VLGTTLRSDAAKRGYELSELIREIIRAHYEEKTGA